MLKSQILLSLVPKDCVAKEQKLGVGNLLGSIILFFCVAGIAIFLLAYEIGKGRLAKKVRFSQSSLNKL